MTLAVGLHCNHDASVAVCDESGVLFSMAEERLSGIKHHAGFPVMALTRAFNYCGIESGTVDIVAFSSTHVFYPRHARSLKVELDGTVERRSSDDIAECRALIGEQRARPRLLWHEHADRHWANHEPAMEALGLLSAHVRHYAVSHHRAHASAAFRTSPFDSAAVLTLDGVGDGISATISCGRADGSLQLRRHSAGENSLGAFYQASSNALGFAPVDGEHKTMGLAAHGKPRQNYGALQGVMRSVDGELQSTVPWRWERYSGCLGNPLGVARDPGLLARSLADLGPSDFARAVQDVLEECVTNYVRQGMSICGSDCVAGAGGVFLNVKANLAVRKATGGRLWIFPDALDSGLAVGAALEALFFEGRTGASRWLWDPYTGDDFSDRAMALACESHPGTLSVVDASPRLVAQEILGGKLIGLFQGRMEAGPRALGHRSLLADPSSRNSAARVREAKQVESFVPFAPSILDGDIANLCEPPGDYRFMTHAANATALARRVLPAVVHADGTMRPQAITDEAGKWFHELLGALREKLGVGAVLNTSFNRHGSPIIASPNGALTLLEDSMIDGLVLGSKYVRLRHGTVSEAPY